MKAVLGIGNPGKRYAGTRHNVGFMVVDELARRAGAPFRSRFQSDAADARLASERALLLKPRTYVNESGRAARQALDWLGLARQDLLAVVDDFNLPLGLLRFRRGGSSGGHRGLESLASHLGGADYPRLRLGIAAEGRRGGRDFVLEPFAVSEREDVGEMIQRAADGVEMWLREGIEACMNAHNVRPARSDGQSKEEENV